jgi:hypothetical protein
MLTRDSKSSSTILSSNSDLTVPTSIGTISCGYNLRVRDQLQTNIVGKKYFLDVNVEHLIMANEHLADKLKNEPADMLPLVTFSRVIV